MATLSFMPAEVKSLIIKSFLSTLVKELVDDDDTRHNVSVEQVYEARVLVIPFAFASKQLLEEVSHEASRLLEYWEADDNTFCFDFAPHQADQTDLLWATNEYLQCVLSTFSDAKAGCACCDFVGDLGELCIDALWEPHPVRLHKWHRLHIKENTGWSLKELIKEARRLWLQKSMSEEEFIKVLKHEMTEELKDDVMKSVGEEIWETMMVEMEDVGVNEKEMKDMDDVDDDEMGDKEGDEEDDEMDDEVDVEVDGEVQNEDEDYGQEEAKDEDGGYEL